MRLRLNRHRTKSCSGGGRRRLAASEGARIPLTLSIMPGSGPKRRPLGVWNLRNVVVDTGADRSGVPEMAVPFIKKALGGKLKIRSHTVVTAGGVVKLRVLEDLVVCIRPPGAGKKKGCCAKTRLVVVPAFDAGFLLGRDLLSPCKAQVDFAKNRLCFDGKECLKLEGV